MVIQLQDLSVCVRGAGELSVHQLQQDKKYTLLLVSLPASTLISQAKSVIGFLNQDLVNVGDSV